MFRGCIDGICTAPNRCSCRDGWVIDNSGTKCEPRCDRACINGQCARTNYCECNPGYRPDPSNPYRYESHLLYLKPTQS